MATEGMMISEGPAASSLSEDSTKNASPPSPATNSNTTATTTAVGGPPVIDLMELSEERIVARIAEACQTYGFFQITSHGIPNNVLERFQAACRHFFQEVSAEQKDRLRRNQGNARGFFDDELTKQKLDWKQCLDVGVPGSRNWSLEDAHEGNACLDGHNQFPCCPDDDGDDESHFRSVVVEYFEECAKLSHKIATYMARGLLLALQNQHKVDNTVEASSSSSLLQQVSDEFVRQLRNTHTSYLRINYYPPCAPQQQQDEDNEPSPLGISPHRDAGFLTVLLQDEDCHSLQVWDEARHNWSTVVPAPNALTVNTGDMAQVWSNGLYKAPLHRVLTHESKVRYSAPFFYNPGYDMWVAPITRTLLPQPTPLEPSGGLAEKEEAEDGDRAPHPSSGSAPPAYHPVLWGYFRAVRFAGDLTDLGVEIQISDFEVGASSSTSSESTPSSHVDKQRRFAQRYDFRTAFSVDEYRELLQE